MIISQHDVTIEGYRLHRTVFNPVDQEVKMACLFTHGQGDFSQRYHEVLHPFTERGIRCISMDLLGHGLSSGIRGHCGNLDLIDQIIDSNLDLTEGLDYGIAGHSMGGLLTLRHLTLALEKKLPTPQFCWVNSPLVQPSNNKADWFIKLAKILAHFAPTYTIKTGATPELCQSHSLDKSSSKNKQSSELKKSLGHQHISLSWGMEVINIAEYIQHHLPTLHSEVPFLLTQGDTDYICPHRFAENLFAKLPFSNKKYELFKGMRHETFAEPNNDELFNVISQWLDLNHLPAQSL